MRTTRIALAAVFFQLSGTTAWAELFDHSVLDGILHRSVDSRGTVDYDDIRQNTYSALDSYLVRVGDADLGGWSTNERLAFWINAFNARILQLIVARPTLKKISDDFEMLNIPFPVAGRRLTPNDILFRILLRRKNPDNQQGPIPYVSMDKVEPEVLFALVPGAVGSPRLRNEAYTADNVIHAIHEDAVAFVNDPQHVDIGPAHIQLSSLFKWYRLDLHASGGVSSGILQWLDPEQHADDPMLTARFNNLLPQATYQYDWTVNNRVKSAAPSTQPTPIESPTPTTND